MKSISIIIPIYNVEMYLIRCLESVVSQIDSKDEIILVNDGSTDNSPQICDEYSAIYKNIIVMHKENGGLSDARNCGLNIASKEYIIFLDSDDFLESYAIIKLKQHVEISKAKVVAYNAKIIHDNSALNRVLLPRLVDEKDGISGIDFLCSAMKKNSFNVCAWLYMYKRDFLQDNMLLFKKGILHEDIDWTIRTLLICDQVSVTNSIIINYVVREGSISRSKDMSRNAIDMMNTISDLTKLTDEIQNSNKKLIINDYLMNSYMASFNIANYRTVGKEVLTRTFILKNAFFTSTKLKALIFLVSPRLYIVLNKASKFLKRKR